MLVSANNINPNLPVNPDLNLCPTSSAAAHNNDTQKYFRDSLLVSCQNIARLTPSLKKQSSASDKHIKNYLTDLRNDAQAIIDITDKLNNPTINHYCSPNLSEDQITTLLNSAPKLPLFTNRKVTKRMVSAPTQKTTHCTAPTLPHTSTAKKYKDINNIYKYILDNIQLLSRQSMSNSANNNWRELNLKISALRRDPYTFFLENKEQNPYFSKLSSLSDSQVSTLSDFARNYLKGIAFAKGYIGNRDTEKQSRQLAFQIREKINRVFTEEANAMINNDMANSAYSFETAIKDIGKITDLNRTNAASISEHAQQEISNISLLSNQEVVHLFSSQLSKQIKYELRRLEIQRIEIKKESNSWLKKLLTSQKEKANTSIQLEHIRKTIQSKEQTLQELNSLVIEDVETIMLYLQPGFSTQGK